MAEPKEPLTEEMVRAIVREELAAHCHPKTDSSERLLRLALEIERECLGDSFETDP